jgi:hypothetical protein
LITALDAHSRKSYHPGFGKSVTGSNPSKANERREPKIFEEYAYHLIDIARQTRIGKTDFEITGNVYAFDSTPIDLCLSVFRWAKFRKHQAGIKIHTLFNIVTQISAFISSIVAMLTIAGFIT